MEETKYKAMTEQLRLTHTDDEVANYIRWIISKAQQSGEKQAVPKQVSEVSDEEIISVRGQDGLPKIKHIIICSPPPVKESLQVDKFEQWLGNFKEQELNDLGERIDAGIDTFEVRSAIRTIETILNEYRQFSKEKPTSKESDEEWIKLPKHNVEYLCCGEDWAGNKVFCAMYDDSGWFEMNGKTRMRQFPTYYKPLKEQGKENTK